MLKHAQSPAAAAAPLINPRLGGASFHLKLGKFHTNAQALFEFSLP